jgi:hypothetical protein
MQGAPAIASRRRARDEIVESTSGGYLQEIGTRATRRRFNTDLEVTESIMFRFAVGGGRRCVQA